MGSCRYQQCQKNASFNIVGDKQAIYCKHHAEASMVNVKTRRCSQNGCFKRSNFNVKGDKKPLYCKNHAVDGMVNVIGRRCFHDSCVKHPSFNVEGTKKPMYCKQHAVDGMVCLNKKVCLHDACSTQPSFNVKGTKPAKYCKTHAEDGMANVVSKVCSRDSCTKRLKLKREDSERPAYCWRHCEETMVDPRPKGPSRDIRTTGAARRAPLNATATGDTISRQSSLDGDAISPVLPYKEVHYQKRSRLNLQVKILHHCVEDYRFKKRKVFEDLAMGAGEEGSLMSCHRALPRHLDDGTVGLAPEHAAPGFRRDISPLPDAHQLRQPIKTEVVVAASF